MNGGKQHISWVDFSKGICILGVVIMYAGKKLGDVGWMQHVIDFMQPFRMPDFFLLSGLFLGRAMQRSWRTYIDKRVIHYLYFFFLWSIIFFLFRLISSQIGLFAGDANDSFLYRLREPYAMLWFIQLLPVLCIFTRVFADVPAFMMVVFGVLLHSFSWDGAPWGLIENFCERFIFFYIGYKFSPLFFTLADKASNRSVQAVNGILIWGLINYWCVVNQIHLWPIMSLVLGLAGAMATIVAGSLFAHFSVNNFLQYLGNNSLVVYLGFYLPMMCFIPIVRKIQHLAAGVIVINDGWIAVIVTVFSIMSALVLYWLTRRGIFRFLFVRPEWISLSEKKSRIKDLGIAQEA